MVHHGFIIKDIKELKIDLNIPPFLGGCSQLPPEKIDTGTKIASLCMNVERVIVSMKTQNILKWNCTFLYGMYHKQNFVVCALQTKFQLL